MFFNSKKGLPSFWATQIVGWLAYWLMICVTFLPVLMPDKSVLALFQHKFLRAFIGFALTCVLRLIYKRFSNYLSIGQVSLLAVSASIVFGTAWTFLMNVHYWLINHNFQFNNALATAPRESLDYSLTILAWSALYLGVKYWQKWQKEHENALEAAALANKAQLEMLRYQLNPHFLFNSLNSIRASIDEDSRKAKEMVTQLAEFLRYSLLNCDEKEVPLREEIEATRNYLAIEKTRFEDKLEVAFDVDERAEELLVPCFLLNPLVENAVKHGLNGSVKPLRILVSATVENNALKLEVSNTGSLNSNGNGTKVGLKNVRERLEKLFAERSNFNLKEEHGWVKAQIFIQGS